MFKSLIKLAIIGATLALAACAPGPHLHVTTAIYSGGQDLDPGMLNRNLIGTVGFDEAHVSKYPILGRTTAYLEGVVPDSPEYSYRMAHINLSHLKGFLFIAPGERLWATTGAIPEHIEKLKAWDLIEYRSSGHHRTLENFSTKQEGNIVVRVLCRKADPDYNACRDALPQIRKYPNGPTGTPYPVSIKEYGYTYTPAYDAKGNSSRVIPEYVAKKP